MFHDTREYFLSLELTLFFQTFFFFLSFFVSQKYNFLGAVFLHFRPNFEPFLPLSYHKNNEVTFFFFLYFRVSSTVTDILSELTKTITTSYCISPLYSECPTHARDRRVKRGARKSNNVSKFRFIPYFQLNRNCRVWRKDTRHSFCTPVILD